MTLVWEKSQHKGSELLLLLAIADNANDQGLAYPSIKTLARKTRLEPRHVKRLLRVLEQGRELTVSIGTGPRGCNEYIIHIEGGDKLSPRMKSTGDVQGQKGVTPTPPEPNTEPKREELFSLSETDLKRLGLTPGSIVWNALTDIEDPENLGL